jgi:hypothetical protein
MQLMYINVNSFVWMFFLLKNVFLLFSKIIRDFWLRGAGVISISSGNVQEISSLLPIIFNKFHFSSSIRTFSAAPFHELRWVANERKMEIMNDEKLRLGKTSLSMLGGIDAQELLTGVI